MRPWALLLALSCGPLPSTTLAEPVVSFNSGSSALVGNASAGTHAPGGKSRGRAVKRFKKGSKFGGAFSRFRSRIKGRSESPARLNLTSNSSGAPRTTLSGVMTSKYQTPAPVPANSLNVGITGGYHPAGMPVRIAPPVPRGFIAGSRFYAINPSPAPANAGNSSGGSASSSGSFSAANSTRSAVSIGRPRQLSLGSTILGGTLSDPGPARSLRSTLSQRSIRQVSEAASGGASSAGTLGASFGVQSLGGSNSPQASRRTRSSTDRQVVDMELTLPRPRQQRRANENSLANEGTGSSDSSDGSLSSASSQIYSNVGLLMQSRRDPGSRPATQSIQAPNGAYEQAHTALNGRPQWISGRRGPSRIVLGSHRLNARQASTNNVYDVVQMTPPPAAPLYGRVVTLRGANGQPRLDNPANQGGTNSSSNSQSGSQ